MKPLKLSIVAGMAAILGLSGFEWDGTASQLSLLGSPAQAFIGHQLTPLSYAGVARRTTRRVARRTAIRVSTLPASCIYGSYFDGYYYRCGGVYYEKSGTTYVQVVIE